MTYRIMGLKSSLEWNFFFYLVAISLTVGINISLCSVLFVIYHWTPVICLRHKNCIGLISKFLRLKKRCTLLLSIFWQNLHLGNIDCVELLFLICFKINFLNIWNISLFYPSPYKTNYMMNNPSNVSMAAGNSITFHFDYYILFFI